MKVFRLILICTILFFFESSQAGTSTVVLQNGVNGYNGCEDAYTFTEQVDSNFSNELNLLIFNCIP